ncbi:MAG: flagellar basal body L-ring protein FlgH [Planctomycetota bacterium]
MRRAATSVRAVVLVSAILAPGLAAQSLWCEGRTAMGNLIGDNVATSVGDLVTIIIRERQLIQDDQEINTEKDTRMDSAVSELNAFPNAFDPLPSMKYASRRSFDGTAEYQRDGRFETSVSARVIDVQPNGNLVIEGKRIITIGDEVKTISISGIVRPLDLSATNSVTSERVADAIIRYDGEGPLSNAMEPGWFEKLLDYIWPF